MKFITIYSLDENHLDGICGPGSWTKFQEDVEDAKDSETVAIMPFMCNNWFEAAAVVRFCSENNFTLRFMYPVPGMEVWSFENKGLLFAERVLEFMTYQRNNPRRPHLSLEENYPEYLPEYDKVLSYLAKLTIYTDDPV